MLKTLTISELKQVKREFRELLNNDDYLQYYFYTSRFTATEALEWLEEKLNHRVFKTDHNSNDVKLYSYLVKNKIHLLYIIFDIAY